MMVSQIETIFFNVIFFLHFLYLNISIKHMNITYLKKYISFTLQTTLKLPQTNAENSDFYLKIFALNIITTFTAYRILCK